MQYYSVLQRKTLNYKVLIWSVCFIGIVIAIMDSYHPTTPKYPKQPIFFHCSIDFNCKSPSRSALQQVSSPWTLNVWCSFSSMSSRISEAKIHPTNQLLSYIDLTCTNAQTNIYKIVRPPGINIPKAQVVVNRTDALAVTCKTIHRCWSGFSMAQTSKALGAILGLAMASCGYWVGCSLLGCWAVFPLSPLTGTGPYRSYSLPRRYFYVSFCPSFAPIMMCVVVV